MNRKQPSKKSRCDAFDEFGWHREAVADYDKAAAILTRLVKQEGRALLADQLTLTLRNRARDSPAAKSTGPGYI